MVSARRPQWRAVVGGIALFWMWALPSAFFWDLALRRGALLPYIPRWFWIGPGELWQVAPWLFIVLVLCATFLIAAIAANRKTPGRGVRMAMGLVFALMTLIHLIWGSALLAP